MPGTNLGGPPKPRRKQRFFPAFNNSGVDCPGYGLMMLLPDDGRGFFTQFKDDDAANVIIRCYPPNAEAETVQDAAMLVVNSEVPLLAGGRGMVTQDWPCQVLHDGAIDRLPNGVLCGPKAGRFEVFSGGRAFVCQSHDATFAAGPVSRHTVWIAPNNGRSGSPCTFGVNSGDQTVSPDEACTIALPPVSAFPWVSSQFTLVNNGKGIKWALPMAAWVAFSATLGSDSAGEGDLLRLVIALGNENDSESGTDTYIAAARRMCIEKDDPQDQSPFRTAENVAASGPMMLGAGLVLRLFNRSTVSVKVSNAIVAIMHFSPALHDHGKSVLNLDKG